MPFGIPTSNVIVVVDADTGTQLMHIVDAKNSSDPAWRSFRFPNGDKAACVHIHVDKDIYPTLDAVALDDHVIAESEKMSFPVEVKPVVIKEKRLTDKEQADLDKAKSDYLAALSVSEINAL